MMEILNILLWLLSGIICLFLIIFIIGIILPQERVVTRQSTLPATPEKLFAIVTNNKDWKYRRDLKDLIILEEKDNKEVWDEIYKNGNITHFRTKEKLHYSLYSFEMKSNLFYGYWVGRFNKTETGKTLFTATEHITIKNPVIKTLSYLFFDIGKIMEKYQEDLEKKIYSI